MSLNTRSLLSLPHSKIQVSVHQRYRYLSIKDTDICPSKIQISAHQRYRYLSIKDTGICPKIQVSVRQRYRYRPSKIHVSGHQRYRYLAIKDTGICPSKIQVSVHQRVQLSNGKTRLLGPGSKDSHGLGHVR